MLGKINQDILIRRMNEGAKDQAQFLKWLSSAILLLMNFQGTIFHSTYKSTVSAGE